MDKKWETVLYEKIGNVARITMNRPEVRNAQNRQLTYELDGAFRQAEEDEEVKVIILAGAGPHFSSGHDQGSPQVKAEQAASKLGPGVAPKLKREQELYMNMCFRWRDIPKPTIAQIQGACIAGGCMLAAVCDLVIASDDARFADPVVRMGFGGVEYFFHPWDLGARKAKEFLFTGDFIDAQEAWRLGFVNRVVPRDKLAEETLKLAQRIALMPAFALQLAKVSVNDTLDVQGFRNAMLSTFKAHQMAHAHNRETASLGIADGPVGEGRSVRDWAQKRDKAFESKD